MSEQIKQPSLESEINDVRILLENANANMATGDISELGKLDTRIKIITERAIAEMANLEDEECAALIANLNGIVKAVMVLNEAYLAHPLHTTAPSDETGGKQ